MNKHESKYFNTAFLFDESLISLLMNKDIEYITIKEICEKAHVNRSTFYLHYETIDDLLNETIKYTVDKLVSHFDKDPHEFINNISLSNKDDLMLINDSYLRPFLIFIKDNKKIFIASFKRPKTMKSNEVYYDLEKYILNPILDKYEIPDYKKKYYLNFYVQGIMGIIKEWVINDCNDDLDTIMNIIIECVKP